MCEFHDSNGNDIWWTDKLIYFSSIDVSFNDACSSKYLHNDIHDNILRDCNKLCTFTKRIRHFRGVWMRRQGFQGITCEYRDEYDPNVMM